MVSETTLRIEVPGAGPVTAVRATPEALTHAEAREVLYAPGAGSSVHDPFGTFLCRDLADRGVAATRFQFPYQEAKRRSPDRPPVLEAAWRAVIAHTAEASPRAKLVLSGRSMGGRIASQVIAAEPGLATGLALFAYPLHPPGKPEQRRDTHLPLLAVPVLFCSGTNDAFASPDELREAAALVPRATVHLLEGADHGFAVRKASGRTREDVWREAADVFWEWLARL